MISRNCLFVSFLAAGDVERFNSLWTQAVILTLPWWSVTLRQTLQMSFFSLLLFWAKEYLKNFLFIFLYPHVEYLSLLWVDWTDIHGHQRMLTSFSIATTRFTFVIWDKKSHQLFEVLNTLTFNPLTFLSSPKLGANHQMSTLTLKI